MNCLNCHYLILSRPVSFYQTFQIPTTISGSTKVLRDRLLDLNIPIVSGLPFGHEGVNGALPMGIIASLDADSGLLSCG